MPASSAAPAPEPSTPATARQIPDAQLSAANPMIIDNKPAYYTVDAPAVQPLTPHSFATPLGMSDATAAPSQNTLASYPPPRKDADEGGETINSKIQEKRAKRKRRESRDKEGDITDVKGKKKEKRNQKKTNSGSAMDASQISAKQLGLEGGDSSQPDENDSTVSWTIPTIKYSSDYRPLLSCFLTTPWLKCAGIKTWAGSMTCSRR